MGDLSKVVNGKNPIVEHMYMGADPSGKNVIVVDDMIATFSLFTEGVEKFIDAYNLGLFNKLYTTNLSYVPKEILNYDWYVSVDCSRYIASIINTFNKKEDISSLWDGKKKIINKIRKKMEE